MNEQERRIKAMELAIEAAKTAPPAANIRDQIRAIMDAAKSIDDMLRGKG